MAFCVSVAFYFERINLVWIHSIQLFNTPVLHENYVSEQNLVLWKEIICVRWEVALYAATFVMPTYKLSKSVIHAIMHLINLHTNCFILLFVFVVVVLCLFAGVSWLCRSLWSTPGKFWRRSFHSENSSYVFRLHALHSRNLLTQQSPVSLDLCLSKSRVRNTYLYRDAIVFEKKALFS